jgi:hypothetical protein
MHFAIVVNIVSANNVRVVESGHGLSFFVKAVHKPAILGQVDGEDFQSDSTAQGFVLGQVNNAHAAKTEALEDLVFTDKKSAPPSAQELLGPENGQEALAHQPARQLLGLGRPFAGCSKLVQSGFETLDIDHTALTDQFQELIIC